MERKLATWGRLIYDAAMPVAHTANVMQAWTRVGRHAERRFSVYVDTTPDADVTETAAGEAREVATLLLGLPWELLHDGSGYLFQGATPTRVRRRLPNTHTLDVPVVATPIRILLVTARPEDQACVYIDHRASAIPLVEATESLPGLVTLHVLRQPTLAALGDELERARRDRQPYHVVHFDGHGVFDRRVGLGALCFEQPDDLAKLEQRRHITVTTGDMGALLRNHRIPLVFLEACQTALAEKASESVASELLRGGIASVVAMSHSVLVETASRFVQAFYTSLAAGKRIGDAMLTGQRQLKDDSFRGRVFGAGELRLEDWFVPVLFQERADPQLFTATPTRQTQDDFKRALEARLGELPKTPETGFIGRSRDLLALERLLREERYAVVRGQGGEGKTSLAAEFARWMVRSHQIRRAAFVSLDTNSHIDAVLDALGRQLAGGDYSVAAFANREKAIQPVERALVEQSTVLVVDNVESILPPPFFAEQTPNALSEEARRELTDILDLCQRLVEKGDTRLVFTSREPLPSPFDAARNRRELAQLSREDAVKLIERALNASGTDAGASTDSAREEIEHLVDAVHAHARTLALLSPVLRMRGVQATHASLVELMADTERRFPNSRERSLFASVQLSLNRMSPSRRQKARVLGVFHGVVNLDVLSHMNGWNQDEVQALAKELVDTGLATSGPFNHLTLHPALSPLLRTRLGSTEADALVAGWRHAMKAFANFLYREQHRKAEAVAVLTVLELPNLLALLDDVSLTGDPSETIDLATSLYGLLQGSSKHRLLDRVGRVRDRAMAALGEDWTRARFQAVQTMVQRDLAAGHLVEALNRARALFDRTREAGEDAYPGADYDSAVALLLLGRVLEASGGSQKALSIFDEARARFEALARHGSSREAERMARVASTEQASSLLNLGRLDDAAQAYERSIDLARNVGDERSVAVSIGQLGTILLLQGRYAEALRAYEEVRAQFTRLNEPSAVAVSWHQSGRALQQTGQWEAAEDAYRRSLAIDVGIGNIVGQAITLGQLGNLYDDALGRREAAAAMYYEAADRFAQIGDVSREATARSNLAATLKSLGRLDEAREEIHRALKYKIPFGQAAEPWKTWAILADIEEAADNAGGVAEARRNAATTYLEYRRAGGENHNLDGRISTAIAEPLLAGDRASAEMILQQIEATGRGKPSVQPFVRTLHEIVAGSREPTLAENPALNYTMAAEVLYLIERLELVK